MSQVTVSVLHNLRIVPRAVTIILIVRERNHCPRIKSRLKMSNQIIKPHLMMSNVMLCPAVDLNTSGLRHSKRIREQNNSQSPEPASRMAYVTKLKEKSKLRLALFSMFCTIAVHTSSALSTTVQAPMKSTRDATSSILSKTVESFHKVNTL